MKSNWYYQARSAALEALKRGQLTAELLAVEAWIAKHWGMAVGGDATEAAFDALRSYGYTVATIQASAGIKSPWFRGKIGRVNVTKNTGEQIRLRVGGERLWGRIEVRYNDEEGLEGGTPGFELCAAQGGEPDDINDIWEEFDFAEQEFATAFPWLLARGPREGCVYRSFSAAQAAAQRIAEKIIEQANSTIAA